MPRIWRQRPGLPRWSLQGLPASWRGGSTYHGRETAACYPRHITPRFCGCPCLASVSLHVSFMTGEPGQSEVPPRSIQPVAWVQAPQHSAGSSRPKAAGWMKGAKMQGGLRAPARLAQCRRCSWEAGAAGGSDLSFGVPSPPHTSAP